MRRYPILEKIHLLLNVGINLKVWIHMIFSTQFDQSSFQIKVTSSIAEQSFTGAIKYVTAEYTPTIYFTTGHDEKDIDGDFSAMKQQLLNNNMMLNQ